MPFLYLEFYLYGCIYEYMYLLCVLTFCMLSMLSKVFKLQVEMFFPAVFQCKLAFYKQ